MLQNIRQHAASWVVKLLFGLLIVSFAVWGIGDIFRQAATDPVALKVGDREVQTAEIANQFRRELSRMQQIMGSTITAEMARQFGLLDEVVDRIVNGVLYDQESARLGVAVSDAVVRQAIRQEPAFQRAGNFDRFAFEQALRQNNLTEEGYVQALRRDLSRGQVIGAIEAGLAAPSSFVDRLYRQRQERRSVESLAVANASFPEPAEPDAAVLVAFHQAEATRFTAPEYRALTFAVLSPDDLAGDIMVSDDKIKEEYDRRVGEFTIQENRDVQQILTSDEDQAKRAHELLGQGRDFAEVAKDVAGMVASAVDLGVVTRDELPEGLAAPAFALGAGAYSAPIKSDFGWHILRVRAISAGSARSLAEVRDQLKLDVAREQALDQLYEMANKIEDDLAAGGRIEDVATKFGFKLRQLAAIDRNGMDAQGSRIDSLPGGTFIQTAFQTNAGDQSPLIEARDGFYFVLRVEGVTPAALKPLEAIRDQVLAAWRANERDKAARERASQLLDRLKGGADFEALAADAQIPIVVSAPFVRASNALPGGLVGR
ncbi:MAG: peptidylprolyl isomerase, partial [Alphaproteobacteria bacterium]|nr:peptidylprolyl isomerase [Alphaproteobacteria bacterium]